MVDNQITNNSQGEIKSKASPSRENSLTILFLLESSKIKIFQPPELIMDYLIDSDAKSKLFIVYTWSDIRSLHPKLPLPKTSSKLATAQSTSSTSYGKIQFPLIPTQTPEKN